MWFSLYARLRAYGHDLREKAKMTDVDRDARTVKSELVEGAPIDMESVPELYTNSVRVYIGTHDFVIDLYRESPASEDGGVGRELVGRLRTTLSSAWTMSRVMERVIRFYVQQNGVFPLAQDYLEHIDLVQAYEELKEMAGKADDD